jgi:hypothetical protein
MRLGDLLEIVAAACLTAAAYLAWGLPAALLVAGVALAYEGQCFGSHPLPKIKLPKVRLLRRKRNADA